MIDVNVILEGKVVIGAGCRIGPHTLLRHTELGSHVEIKAHSVVEGAIIGDHCVIGPFARLRPGTLLASQVHVGNFVELKNTEMGEGSKANHLSYVGDSVVGSDVNIAAGAICANFRFDGKKIDVRYNNDRYDTGLDKFGCVIGDTSQIGVNAILNPGSILGKNIVVWPLVRVFGTHKNDEVLK